MFIQKPHFPPKQIHQQDLSSQMNDKTASFESSNDENDTNDKKPHLPTSLEKTEKMKIIINYSTKDETEKLIHIYGRDLFYNLRDYEYTNHPQQNFLSKHKINPSTRTKMIDWMLEVLSVYNSEQETFFLSVLIFDSFLSNHSTTLNDSDVHLLGIVCMLIASKFEDTYPIQLRHAVERISHNCFNANQIKEKEKQILITLNFDLCFTSTYDYITFLFFDFYANNTYSIENLDLERYLDLLENISVFLSKLMNYSEKFSSIK